jgi:hypothetical protein
MRLRRSATMLAAAGLVLLGACNLGVPADSYRLAPGEGNGTGPAAVGDLDGANGPDLVVPTFGGWATALNQGDGKFVLTDTAVDHRNGEIVLGDLDGDGDADSVQGPSTDPWGTLQLRRGDGHGGLAETPFTLAPPAGQTMIRSQALADVDEDGDLDIVAVALDDFYSMHTYVWRNQSTPGTFAFAAPAVVPQVPAPAPYFALGDVDGDDHLDLVAGLFFEGPRGVGVALGNGDGTFRAMATYPTWLTNLDTQQRVALGDVDGDGSLDVIANQDVTSGEFVPNLSVLLNDGDGTFGEPVVTNQPGRITAAAPADFDGDGHLDIAIDKAVLFGAGDGTFPRHRDVSGGPGSQAVDVDRDGRPDLAYAWRDAVVVLRNAL